MNFYGIATIKEIELFTGEVCEFFDGKLVIDEKYNYHYNQKYLNAYNLMMETMATETHLGEWEDTDVDNGMGLAQIDLIKWKDIQENSMEHRKAIWNKWHIDLKLVAFEALRYGWKQAIILTRLGYKRIPALIPSTRKERANYWKQYWNTYKGAGTTKHYLEMCEQFLGQEK